MWIKTWFYTVVILKSALASTNQHKNLCLVHLLIINKCILHNIQTRL